MDPGETDPNVVLERLDPGSDWQVVGPLISALPDQPATIDFDTEDSSRWRIRPLNPLTQARSLSLQQMAFGGLVQSLSQNLTAKEGPGIDLVEEGPRVHGVTLVTSAGSSQGELWLAWLSANQVSVWKDGLKTDIPPLPVNADTASLFLKISPQLEVIARGPSGLVAAVWSGKDWVPDPHPALPEQDCLFGTFRTLSAPPKVLRKSATAWDDLNLPAESGASDVLLGAMESQLWAGTRDEKSRWHSWFTWNEAQGWQTQALPNFAQSHPQLWGITGNRDGIFVLTNQNSPWSLTQFDGVNWRPGITLTATVPITAGTLMPPMTGYPLGVAILASDRIRVYALP